MLSAARRAHLRAIVAGRLTSTATRIREVTTTNDLGGQTPGTPEEVDYSCLLVPSAGREQEIGLRLTSAVTYTAYLPHDADVAGGDRLVIDGVTYEVMAVLERGVDEPALRVLVVHA